MSPQLPRVTASQVIRVLEKLDFGFTRQSGSHRIYRDASNNRVTVPFHAGKILHPRILKSILDDANLTVEEFVRILKD